MSIRTDTILGLRMAFIDMSGTTFQDNGIMEKAFSRTVQTLGVDAESPRFARMLAFVRETMGQSKVRVFQHLFADEPALAVRAIREFERAFDDLLTSDGIAPVPGAEQAVEQLRESGLKVCLATGYNRHSQNMILEELGWMGLGDLSLCPADAGRGRPYPDMILTALLALDLGDVREVMVVGDTVADMQSGVRAGSQAIVGVRTGGTDDDALLTAGAHTVMDSICAVPDLVVPPSLARTA